MCSPCFVMWTADVFFMPFSDLECCRLLFSGCAQSSSPSIQESTCLLAPAARRPCWGRLESAPSRGVGAYLDSAHFCTWRNPPLKAACRAVSAMNPLPRLRQPTIPLQYTQQELDAVGPMMPVPRGGPIAAPDSLLSTLSINSFVQGLI